VTSIGMKGTTYARRPLTQLFSDETSQGACFVRTIPPNLADVETFGAIDADADELLRICFQDHPAYEDARAHKRFLIVGRKGSGKTAIYKRLITERVPTTFAYGYTFDDYPWQHHDLQAQTGVPEERRYLNSWKYLVLLTLAKVVLNEDQSQPWSEQALESLEALEDFVVDSYGTRNPDVAQLFAPPKRRLRFKGSLKAPFATLEAGSVEVRELPIHVQEVNRRIANHVFTTLNPEADYYICFDQLDLGFDTEQPIYSQRLISLLLAARELSAAAHEEDRRLSVIVFLRDDIYDMLQFEDKNKLTQNYMSTVEWHQREPGSTLRQLMERRFGEALKGEETIRWTDVFDESKQMTGRQTKYDHICDRTFLRPRDMIQFCNEILAVYKAADEKSDAFANEHIINARQAYSRYLLQELDDEIHKHVPHTVSTLRCSNQSPP
jgi:hypothetical protein